MTSRLSYVRLSVQSFVRPSVPLSSRKTYSTINLTIFAAVCCGLPFKKPTKTMKRAFILEFFLAYFFKFSLKFILCTSRCQEKRVFFIGFHRKRSLFAKSSNYLKHLPTPSSFATCLIESESFFLQLKVCSIGNESDK